MSRVGGPGFVVGALLGAAVGTGLGIIFAPRSGDETRRDLAAWRDSETAVEGGQSGQPELIELSQVLLKQALQRVSLALRAAQQASDSTSRSLVQEWEA